MDEQYKGTSTYEYHRNQFRLYAENDAVEPEIKEALAEILYAVYPQNQPVKHSYQLSRN
ncbi:hypothetical protein [Dyadobacter tibetensis]|uniref:hypothetical protein n=1 Tax=Dyadobacter tibetensis TaxID=1211851 RepID=UPI0004B19897|nr:hypothetical protein [Dyadobacter tibetensis]